MPHCLPRSGRFDLVTSRDIMVMFHILKEIPVNFLELILVAMKEVVNKKKAPLLDRMTLIHIFKIFRIRLKGEESCGYRYTDTYDHSLH